MTIEETAKLIKDHWQLVLTTVLTTAPATWVVVNYVHRYRRAEQQAATSLAFLDRETEYKRKIADLEVSTAAILGAVTATPGDTMRADMASALQELRGARVRRLRIVSYVGNSINDSLTNWTPLELDGVDLRVIVRDHRRPWRLPDASNPQQQTRKADTSRVLRRLAEHPAWEGLAHRSHGGDLDSAVSFFIGEPVVRVVQADMLDGEQRLILGFYPPKQRGTTKDFTGTGSPVMQLSANSPMEASFIESFALWFDHVFPLLPKPSTSLKPLLALDFDGVIADTGSVKAQWILEHLGKEFAADRTNRDDCIGVIEEAEYNLAADFAYGIAGTSAAPPVRGAVQALRVLANDYRFALISARTPERLNHAKTWLAAHRIAELFESVESSDGSEKPALAHEKVAFALIDDNARHLAQSTFPATLHIHFGRESSSADAVAVTSWDTLKGWLQWIARSDARILV